MDIFAKNKVDTLAELGEVKLIEAIKGWLGHTSPPSPAGIGDDCAVIHIKEKTTLLITTDSLVYNRHFDADLAPELAGQKLVKRNLSDIAAMGGFPSNAVIALMLSRQVNRTWLQQFYQGIQACAHHYRLAIVGGDICEVDPLFFGANMTLHGHAPQAITREGAQAGDAILVSGTLGGSILHKHWNFTPRLKEGQWLAQQPAVTAMMDVTDGLAKDLLALTPNGCQAALNPQSIPISDDAKKISQQTQKTPLHHALSDGEDYELVFTLAKDTDVAKFIYHWQSQFNTSITHIGHCTPKDAQSEPDLIDIEHGNPIAPQPGFTHLQ